jgi:hypothetical protein
VVEVPRGSYIPVSHSLIVCWRVPSLSAISRWVSPRWCLNAWMCSLSHCGRLTLFCFLLVGLYMIPGRLSNPRIASLPSTFSRLNPGRPLSFCGLLPGEHEPRGNWHFY